MSRARLILPAIAVSALALSGCVSLFPKQKAAQLYRFDAAPGGATDLPASGDGVRVEVIAPPVMVTRAAAGDQILAITGDEAAFVAGARWVSPAAVLWDEAVRRAFATRSARVRLLSRNELGGGRAFLRVDVPTFEVRYPAAGGTPAAVVTLHALYTHRNGVFAAERTFSATVPAGDDRLSAIVPAIDRAVETVTTELLSWADAGADDAAREVPALGAAAPPTPARGIVRSTSTSTTTTTPRP